MLGGSLNGREGFGVFAVVGVLTVAIAIAELCVMRYGIVESYSRCRPGWYYWCTTYATSCLLGDDPNDYDACSYGYAVGAVSLFFSVIICLCAHTKTLIINTIMALCALGWWIAAAIVLTKYSKEANDRSLPEQNSRNAIIGLSWTNVALFGVFVVFTLLYCVRSRSAKPSQLPPPPEVQVIQMQPTYAAQPPPGAYGAPAGYPPAFNGYPPPPPGNTPQYSGYPPQPGGYPPPPAGYTPPPGGYAPSPAGYPTVTGYPATGYPPPSNQY